MKVTFTILVFTILCSVQYPGFCQAKKGKYEIAVGVGYTSIYDLSEYYGYAGVHKLSSAPVYVTACRYHLSRKISLGLSSAYQQFNVYFLTDSAGGFLGAVSKTFVVIMPDVTFNYLDRIVGARKNELRVYGTASAGIAVITERAGHGFFDRVNRPALQLTPIGVRFGREVAGFFEAGFGSKGAVNMGLSYRFP